MKKKPNKISAKELEEIFEDYNDPVKQARRELEKKREERQKEKLRDLGI